MQPWELSILSISLDASIYFVRTNLFRGNTWPCEVIIICLLRLFGAHCLPTGIFSSNCGHSAACTDKYGSNVLLPGKYVYVQAKYRQNNGLLDRWMDLILTFDLLPSNEPPNQVLRPSFRNEESRGNLFHCLFLGPLNVVEATTVSIYLNENYFSLTDWALLCSLIGIENS